MSIESHGGELIAAAGKASPSLAVGGAVAMGISLQDWVLIATLVYTALQIALLVYNFAKKRDVDDDAE